MKTRKVIGNILVLLPAPSSFLNFGANVMGELVLEVNELTLKK